MARWYQSHWCVLAGWIAFVIATAVFVACLGCTLNLLTLDRHYHGGAPDARQEAPDDEAEKLLAPGPGVG